MLSASSMHCLRAICLILCVVLAFAISVHARDEEPLYPAALLNWMVDGTFHALIVDKSKQTLSVWRIEDGEPRMIESYGCSTGEKQGDKWVRGDMKTPEGVYFFCSVIEGRKLPPKYGLWAFTTDYPNFVDRRRGKSGDGIWLHGRDKPVGGTPDSNGCIALDNHDLIKVSRFIRLQSTPLIVVKKIELAPRSVIMDREREVRDFIESWRQAWESQNLDRYMKHYSRNFQSCWLDYHQWKERKARLIGRYSTIKVRLGKVYIYRQDGIITSIFTQAYRSDKFGATGIKVLYLTDEGGCRIYAEDFHQPVDDTNPARTLIAEVGGDTGPEAEPKFDYRIRLVSTDDPDVSATHDIESPRPVAPSRAVVTEKMDSEESRAVAAPPLEANRKVAAGSSGERLIIAQLIQQAPADGQGIAHPPSNARRPAQVVAQAARPKKKAPSDPGGKATRTDGPKGPAVQHPPSPIQGQVLSGLNPAPAAPAGDENAAVMKFLDQWKSAWEKKDLDRFRKMYHPDFKAGKIDYAKFMKSKRAYFRKYRKLKVEIEQVQIGHMDGQIQVRFLQLFRGDDYSDKGWKSMVLGGGKDKGLKVLTEQWNPL